MKKSLHFQVFQLVLFFAVALASSAAHAQAFSVTASDTSYLGSPSIRLNWTQVTPIFPYSVEYKVERSGSLIATISTYTTTTFTDNGVVKGTVYDYCVTAVTSFFGSPYRSVTACDFGFTYDYQDLLSASDTASDAFVDLEWSIPFGCLRAAGGNPVYVQLKDRTLNKELYTETIDSFLWEPFYEGEYRHWLDSGATRSYELNLYKVGPGTPLCQGLFADTGKTKTFQPPVIWATDGFPDWIGVYWDNESDLASKIRVYRDGKMVAILDSTATDFREEFRFNDTSSVQNGHGYEYCIEVYNTRLNKAYPKVCASDTLLPISFAATDESFPNKVNLSWNDMVEYANKLKVLRDGQVIATLPGSATSYTDKHPTFGKRHLYGLRLAWDSEDLVEVADSGGVEENGHISGRITTLTGSFAVGGVAVTAQYVEVTDTLLSTTTTDATGYYAFPDFYYGTGGTVQLTAELADHTFQQNPVSVSLSPSSPVAANVDFKDLAMVSAQGSAALSFSNLQLTPVAQQDYLNISWNYSTPNKPTWFQIFRDNQLIDLVTDNGGTLTSYTDRTGQPGKVHTYIVKPYVVKNDTVTLKSLTKQVTYPAVAVVDTSNLSVTASGAKGTVQLSWGHTSQNFSGFKVYRDSVEIAVLPPSDTVDFMDVKGTSGQTFTYAVVPVISRHGQEYEAAWAVAAPVQYPDLVRPGGVTLVANPQGSAISGSWSYGRDTSYNYDGFMVVRVLSGDADTIAWINKHFPYTFTDETGTPGSNYRYDVYAYKSSDFSLSTRRSATLQFPDVEAADSIAASDHFAAGFVRVSIHNDATNTDGMVLLTGTDTAWLATGTKVYDYIFSPPYSYGSLSFTLKNYREADGQKYFSSGVSDNGALAQDTSNGLTNPTNFSASQEYSNHVRLNWDYPVYLLAQFHIYRDNVRITTLQPDQRVFYDYQAQPGVEYVYQIQAQHQTNRSNRIGDHGRLSSHKVLSGTATSLEGIGIPGVQVKAELDLAGQTQIFSAMTDSAGYYRISGIPGLSTGVMTVTATKANHAWEDDTLNVYLQSTQQSFTANYVDTFNRYEVASEEVAAITFIKATPNEITNTIEVYWNVNSSNYSGFKIFRGLSEIATVPKGENMVAVDDGGYPEMLYFYRVKAFWDLPEGRIESEFLSASATYPGVPPVAGLQVQPNAQKDYMQIAWSHPSNNVSFYEVSRDSVVLGKVLPTSQMNFTDTSGLPDQQYSYTVKAVRQIGNRTFSSVGVSKMGTFPAIAPVDDLAAQAAPGDNAVLLTWTHQSANFQGYRIYRDRQLIDVIDTTTPVLSYLDYTGQPGANYLYAVAPYDIRQGMPYEARPEKVSLMHQSILPPTNLAATPVDSMDLVRLTWDYTPTGNTGFKVYNGNVLIATVTDSSIRSYDDPSGVPGAIISYRISAYAIRGTLYESAKVSALATFPVVAAPRSLSASDGTSAAVKLAWHHPSAYNQGFIVYRDNVAIDTLYRSGSRFYDDVINNINSTLTSFSYQLKAFRTVGANWYTSAFSNADNGSFNNGYVTLAPDTLINSGDRYGYAVDISGDFAVVGVPLDDDKGMNSGSAIILKKDNRGNWLFHQQLFASDGAADDNFGWAVAISGTTVVVGAPSSGIAPVDHGSIYVFEYSNGSWVQQSKLVPSGVASYDFFGGAVDVEGNYIVAGAQYADRVFHNTTGAVYVFTRGTNGLFSSNNYDEWADPGADHGQYLGSSISISGNTVIAGQYGYNSLQGRAVALTLSGGSFSGYSYLQPTGGTASNLFGWKVQVDAGRVIIGARGYNSYSGAVYVFEKASTGNWVQQHILVANDGAGSDEFYVAGISGNHLIIGASGDDDRGSSSGSAYHFQYNSTSNSWTQVKKLNGAGTGANAWFGYAVATDKASIVGAQGDDQVYFFNFIQPPSTATATDGTSNKTKVEWQHPAPTSLSKFNVYREGELIASPSSNQTFYFDTDGEPGKRYVYSVSAVDQNGGESAKLSDVGYSEANGKIQGSVITLNSATGVPGVMITATSTVAGEIYRYTATTDFNGEFELNNVYYADSANYLVRASYPLHSFVQDTFSVTLETNTNQVVVNPFVDKTSFIIRGKLARTQVRCGLDSVKVRMHTTINGQMTTQEVYTDQEGKYSFNYNPLDPNLDSVVIEPEPLQVKSVGANADSSTLQFSPARASFSDFSAPVLLTEQPFTEITTYPIDLAVQNTCGPLSGMNFFYVNIRTADDCYNQTVKTDGFGKLLLDLPPLNYIMTVQDVEPIALTNLPVLRYLQVRPKQYNLKEIHNGNRVAQLPNDSLDLDVEFVFHKVPFITASGISTYLCNDPNQPAVMTQGDEAELSFDVKENHGGNNCPVSEGFLVIKNQAATEQEARIDYNLETGVFPSYKFVVGEPSLVAPHTHYLIVEYHTEEGGYQGEFIKAVIVEGTKGTPGNDIIVETGRNQAGQVQLPLYVLRDPPGDGSYSYIEKGTKFTRTLSVEDENTGFAAVSWEGAFTFFGVGTKVGVSVKTGGGTGRGGEFEVSVETKERIETSAESMMHNKNLNGWMVGDAADVIVGAGIAQQYGLAQKISVDPASCKVINQYIISTAPSNITTTWIYTVDQIRGLIQEYDSQMVKLEQGTLIIEGKTEEEAKNYVRTLKYNWQQILRYHQTTTVPYYNLCDTRNYDDLPEPFRTQVKAWAENGFCNEIGSYKTENGQVVFELKPNITWSSELLEKYNKVNQVVRNLTNEDYQLNFPGGLTWGGSFSLDNVSLNQEYLSQYGADAENTTFSGGSTFSKEIAVTKAASRSFKQSWHLEGTAFAHLFNDVEITQSAGTALGAFFAIETKAVNVTLEGGLDAGYNHTFQRDATNRVDTSATVGYVLSDDDPGDQYSVTAIRGIDPAYTPYFSLLGGRTSCPDEPGAIRRDVPILSLETPDQQGFNPHQRNLDPNVPAVYPIKLSSNNPFGESRWYQLYVVENTNQYNAKFDVGGSRLGTIDYFVPAGGSVYTNLEVTRSPNHYQHLDLAIALRPVCDQFYNLDQLNLQAEWKSPCSPISILTDNNWVINAADSGDREQLIIELGDYDLNNEKLEYAEVQYRRQGSNEWKTIAQIPKDTLVAYYERWKTNPPLPPSYFVIWDITGNSAVLDGQYELRALAKCGVYGNILSNTVNGTIDRSVIRLFGTPQPSDGLLSLGDEISVNFNKPIDCAALKDVYFTFLKNSDSTVIDVTWSCSGSKIIFIPVDPLSVLDGEIITATVDSVVDLFANRLQSPITWQFEISNNPIYWNPSQLTLDIYRGSKDTLRARLLNTSTGNHSFIISGTNPTWLRTIPTAGSVPPVGMPIDVVVDATNLTLGTYVDTIEADITGFGKEKLPVTVNVFPTPPNWKVNPARFSRSVNVIANFKINNGPTSTDSLDRIAVAVGPEVRGVANIKKFGTNNWVAYLTIYGNSADIGKRLNFRVWDASTGIEYDAYPASAITFSGDNTIHGTILGPEILNVQQSRDSARYIPLNEGWTWFSLNTQPTDMGVNSLLRSISPNSGDVLKTLTTSSEYLSGQGWISLNGLDSFSVDSGYLIHLAEADTLRLSGNDAAVNLLSLPEGWSLIGFPHQQSFPVDTIWFSQPKAGIGDILKSQTQTATYDSVNGNWQGSLQVLRPNRGYMLKLGHPAVVDFFRADSDDPKEWKVDHHAYEYNMVMTGMIEIDHLLSIDEEDKVAAFIGGECRGMAQLQYVQSINRYLLTMFVYSNVAAGEVVEFKIYDADRRTTYKAVDVVSFAADSIAGSFSSPFYFRNQFGTGIQVDQKEQISLFTYPNPFSNNVNVEFSDTRSRNYSLYLLDALGRKVYADQFRSLKGANHLYIDLSHIDLKAGFYFIRLESKDVVVTEKLMRLQNE